MTDQAAPRPWRCFVAVPLPGELREDLRTWMTTVRRDGSLDADWRWTDPDGWHLTLAFLGATPADAVPAIVDRLAAVAGESEDFAVAAGGIGAFPGRNRARVLWYGVRDEERRLAELAQRVRA
ncbi:MAG TPA: RNA 2',3'-cyclic phosphodiesterase, partial [Candidatus Limnocylindria bacterium]|nr:RNA 2',3'-cyclic phosphodiesterase [Candidatus Limnocylindria bacterium]